MTTVRDADEARHLCTALSLQLDTMKDDEVALVLQQAKAQLRRKGLPTDVRASLRSLRDAADTEREQRERGAATTARLKLVIEESMATVKARQTGARA